jgi:hypothetical protein
MQAASYSKDRRLRKAEPLLECDRGDGDRRMRLETAHGEANEARP